MDSVYLKRNFLCIDLKSFFASCECVDKGLDPFSYPLVVANPNQGNGAITLAVTPYLKDQGVKSRGRLYEIPKNIKYHIAKPRMSLYIAKSKEVVSIYLKYVAEEDLHVYSIDECFLDLTNYLKMYQKTDLDMAKTILDDIKNTTGLTATCGIGPNMLLAKVAMDVDAKHSPEFIAKWSYEDVPTKLWSIKPLSNMWGIGRNMERRLNNLGIYSVYDLAHYDYYKLKAKFGVMGTELWNHANGIDLSLISTYKTDVDDKSYSHSQVLFKDYNESNIGIIIREMIEVLASRLRANKKVGSTIGFGIGYSKNIGGGFYHSIKLNNPTDSENIILDNCMLIFDKFYEYLPIRRVSICIGNLSNKEGVQLSIFDSASDIQDKENIDKTIDEIKLKFGKNSLLKASSLLNDSTIKERNKKIGGHSA